MFPDFLVDQRIIRQRIDSIKPSSYARTRNDLDGAVTHLSPFITHGIINTRTVADAILEHHSGRDAEKLLTELAWREFFHRVWQQRDNEIFTDLRQPQENVVSRQLPEAIVNASTGITTIDTCLKALINHGYMHNHARMWVAAITCNVGRTHWYQPAQWLYYHLLDGDLASNCLSWQWVAGSFSHRKYYANQENINRFSKHIQNDTFLDTSYESLPTIAIPNVLQQRSNYVFDNQFPTSTATPIAATGAKVLLYSIWNLDPTWRASDIGRRILLIEPSQHTEFALSPQRWQFIEHWAKQVTGLEIFVGEISELFPNGTNNIQIISREYPATRHWPTGSCGYIDDRRWCYPAPDKAIKSFSSYWKPVRKASEIFK